MNKTININIGGTFFHIDEEAYDELQHYLVILKKSFHNTQGSDEIISDIEYRIAELFSERLTEMRQVINRKDVDQVIEIMGRPEEFKEEADEESSFTDSINQERASKSNSDNNSSSSGSKKRSYDKQLYRDPETGLIGGVLAGFAHYINFDRTWIRIIWILLSFTTLGTFLLIYVILWAIIPEPKNSSDRLKMKGERINVSNIERSIKNEFENFEKEVGEFSNKVKNTDFKQMGENVKRNAKRITDKGQPFIKRFFRLIAKVIGIIILIFTSMATLFLFFTWFIAGVLGIEEMSLLADINMMNETNLPIWLVTTLAFILAVVPVILFMILGLKLTFIKSNRSYKSLALSLVGIWFITVLVSIFFGFQQGRDYQTDGSKTTTDIIDIDMSNELRFMMNPQIDYEDQIENRDAYDILHLDNGIQKILSNDINIILRQGLSTDFEVKVKRKAQGHDLETAKERASKIEYIYKHVGQQIIFNEYFIHDFQDKIRGQEVDITLFIPENSTFKLEENLYRYLYTRLANDMNFSRRELVNHKWKLINKELKCLDCKSNVEEVKEQIDEIKTSDVELGTQTSDSLSEDYNF